MLESAFRQGMLQGHGINHENISEEEKNACEEYLESIEEIKSIKRGAADGRKTPRLDQLRN